MQGQSEATLLTGVIDCHAVSNGQQLESSCTAHVHYIRTCITIIIIKVQSHYIRPLLCKSLSPSFISKANQVVIWYVVDNVALEEIQEKHDQFEEEPK